MRANGDCTPGQWAYKQMIGESYGEYGSDDCATLALVVGSNFLRWAYMYCTTKLSELAVAL